MTAPLGLVDDLGFAHHFEPGSRGPPLLVLHKTGAAIEDLLPFARAIAPDAPLLAPRGQVIEEGKPRFFRRLSAGVFDEADLAARAHALADFVEAARCAYGLRPPVALGLSNGANIAAAVLLLRPEVLAGAALLRPAVPFQDPPAAALGGKPVLIVSGCQDRTVPAENTERLARQLSDTGAALAQRVVNADHGLVPDDEGEVARWLTTLPVRAAA